MKMMMKKPIVDHRIKSHTLTAAVAMFSDDVSVTILRSDAQSFADLKPEARRVQHGSTADHAVHRQAAHFPRNVRHYIH